MFLGFFRKTRKENDLVLKYRLLGGRAENASSPTISQIEQNFMILFHLQTLGAGGHILIL